MEVEHVYFVISTFVDESDHWKVIRWRMRQPDNKKVYIPLNEISARVFLRPGKLFNNWKTDNRCGYLIVDCVNISIRLLTIY